MIDYRHPPPLTELPALQRVYGAVFSQPPYNEGPEMVIKFAEWLADEATKPGFDLVAAYDGSEMVGFAYGYRMPAGEWWRRTDRPAPEGVREGEKFAVMEWAVLPDRRGMGVGRAMLDELLAGRDEPYATLTVNPAAAARGFYERLGWDFVASTKPGRMPGMDVMVLPLR